jgi:nanoRNase/pAp phosphatase (c-di-AMP/oligoRNAs hydrolase)
MTISAAEKLRRFFDKFSGDDQVLLAINADPDAIASALAVKRLLWRKVAGVTISNINVIKRPDNLAMIRLLGIYLVRFDQINLERFTRFVLIDSQPDHHACFQTFVPDAIIDHHPDTGTKASFTDIRPKYGATATILTEYLRAAKIVPSSKLATALFYAIKTDTNNFQRHAQIEDVRAFQFLFKYANANLGRKIEQAEIRLDFLKYYKQALSVMRMRKGRVFVHLGPVTSADISVLIADFFMKVSSVRWSIVSAINDRKLIIVFRNDGVRKNAGKVAKEGFGKYGSAGGHSSMARAEIPIGMLQDQVAVSDSKALQNWIIQHVEKRAGKK